MLLRVVIAAVIGAVFLGVAVAADIPPPLTQNFIAPKCGTKHHPRVKGSLGRSVKSYPICFFKRRPDATEMSAFHDKTSKLIKVHLGPRSEIAYSANDRWVSASGYSRGHNTLKAVWPRIGCVGQYISQQDYIDYRRCVFYLKAVVDKWEYTKMGQASEGDGISGQLFCDGM